MKLKKATFREFASSKYIYALVFVAGAVAFLYPLISNAINVQGQTRMITRYVEDVDTYNQEDIEKYKREAEDYNRYIGDLEGNVTDELTDAERATTSVVYMSVLSTGEAIGYVRVPKLDIDLPIYRGTSDAVLNVGVGHLERSSLPVGGTSTHSVLMGHRGLPSSRLFRDLGLLKTGDIFFINTLGETLAYEVESITTVLPTEVESLQVQEGRDLCTLITCEPYMINSHRLLVTGHRIGYSEGSWESQPLEQSYFFQRYWEYFVIVGFFVVLWLVIFLVQVSMRKRQRSREQDES